MNLDPDWQSIYVQIGRLLETAPPVDELREVREPEFLRWMGRARALVDESRVGTSSLDFGVAVVKLSSAAWREGAQDIFTILYRVLGYAEMRAPVALAGSFVPVGNQFDAFAAVSKLMKPAVKDVFIVDPYLDESVLTDFGAAVPDGIQLRLLADAATVKPGLAPAAQRWTAQHGSARPLAVRLAPPKTLHDRAIFVDGVSAWTVTQSLKDLAKRAPAEIIRADDIAALKIPAYESVWAGATILV